MRGPYLERGRYSARRRQGRSRMSREAVRRWLADIESFGRLAGEGGDEVEVLVQVQDGELGELGG